MSAPTAIYINGLTVSFGGFVAINNLTMEILYGQVRAIIGPNGAGKTTLLDVVTGKTKPQKGEVFLDKDKNILGQSEPITARQGIGRKFQKPSVFEQLTVLDNLELAARGHTGIWDMIKSTLSPGEAKRIDSILDTISLSNSKNEHAGSLSHGQKQWLEIGMLLVQNPKVLLLDEPVAGMSDYETKRTAELIRSLKTPERAVVVIEHDMDFVAEIADMVTVMHEGKILMEGTMDKVKSHPQVMEVYLGR